MKIVWSVLPCLSSLRRRGLLYSELEGTLYYVFGTFVKKRWICCTFSRMHYYGSIIHKTYIKTRMMSKELHNILTILQLKFRDINIFVATLKIFSTNQFRGSEKSATRPRSGGARERARGREGNERRGTARLAVRLILHSPASALIHGEQFYSMLWFMIAQGQLTPE